MKFFSYILVAVIHRVQSNSLLNCPALLALDECRFGAVPKSSTTLALQEMVHHWTMATDGNGATRTLLFDHRKAFDLIDHSVLIHELRSLS